MRLTNLRYKLSHQLRASRPHFSRTSLDAHGYASQYGQDKWIAEVLLPGLRGGVFVDVGAHDGVALSNTLYLERALEWTGLAIEPNPEVFERLRANRVCRCVQAGVGGTMGQATFRVLTGYPEMLSGLVDEYHPKHRERIERELAEHDETARDIRVPVYPLNDLLAEQGIDHIDYLDIDVEGGEWSILSAFDMRRFPTRVIGVENNYGDRRIPGLLKGAGYRLNAVIGSDELYATSDVAPSRRWWPPVGMH